MKSFDGHDKSLLRAIAKDLVPASVLERRKVPFPITYDTGYKEFLTGGCGRCSRTRPHPSCRCSTCPPPGGWWTTPG